MHYRQNTNHNRQTSGFNSFGQRQGFNHRFRKPEKQLDPNLFIKKATDELVGEVFVPNSKFSDYNIHEKIKRNILDHGYLQPTEIQYKTIPQIIEGRDVVGIANTGTGKTAAFLITLINKSFYDRNQRALIVVPTRELAVQIRDEFKIFAKGTDIEAVAVIGGVNIKKQTYELRHRPHFVIGTPGRIKDLIQRRELNLMQFQNVVLDEVDRMLDIGFITDIKYIISLLPKIRQSLFFSATVDRKTQDIVNNFVANPITVSVKQQETAENIEQDIIRITNKNSKIDVLHDLLAQPGFDKVLVFGRTKWGMEKLARTLIERGFKVAAIHGNKSQNQRQKALQEFKDNKLQVLIATDVASRGLDIKDVTHVINYDAPTNYEDYIHRIGRTGRAGKTGIALTFVE
jgi:superfamily II DNA/RNA helicase